MSVLNKMLRDLEQRQPHTTTAVKAIPVGAGQRKTLMAILLLSCLLLHLAKTVLSAPNTLETQ